MRVILILIALCLVPNPGAACVGKECLQIWSSEPGGGRLTIEWDFDRKVQTYESFCTEDRSSCLFTAIDPGFIATVEDTPDDSFYPLVEGTTVRFEVVAIADGLTVRINGQSVHAGQSASLGTMPTIHVHPSWQIEVAGDQVGDFPLTFRIVTDSPLYESTAELTVIATNAEPIEPTPTATPEPQVCAGDCDEDEQVTVDEVLRGVAMALGTGPADDCPPFDANHDGDVSVDEIITAITRALEGCDASVPVTFEQLQEEIFTPRCATAFCHDSTSHTGNLDLSAGSAYDELVGVEPDILSAQSAGLLRVRANDPEGSFLLIKLLGPPPSQGSRMPLVGELLSSSQTDQVRDWILQGALP